MEKEFSLSKFTNVIDFIKVCHERQVRKFSMCPYYIHPIRVACLVMKYKQSHKIDDLIIASLLHDVIEDTKITEAEIELLYGWQVLSLVQELTSDSAEQRKLGKTEYLKHKLSNMSSWGLVIKLCDRLDNVMDFAYADTKFIQKYGKETLDILSHIELNRDLSTTHEVIIEDIKKYVAIHYASVIL